MAKIKSRTTAGKTPHKQSKGKGYPPLLQQRMNIVLTVFVTFMFSAYNAVVTKGYVNYEATRYMTFRVAMLVTLAALIVVWIIYRNTQPKWAMRSIQECARNVEGWEWALIAYLFVGFLSALFSDYQHYAFLGSSARNEGYLMLLCYGVTFFLVSRFCKPKKWVFYVFAISCAVLAFYGILQYFGIDPLALNMPGWTGKYVIGFYSSLSNANAASALLTISIMLSSILFIQSNKYMKDWIFYASVLVIWLVLCMGETDSGLVGMMGATTLVFPLIAKDFRSLCKSLLLLGSVFTIRAGYSAMRTLLVLQQPGELSAQWKSPFLWMGLICFLGALTLFFHRKKMPGNPFGKKWRRIWWIVIVLCLILGIVLLPTLAKYTNNVMINEAARILQGDAQLQMGSGRIYVWSRAWDIYKTHPVLGVGPDAFYPEFYSAYNDESVQLMGVTYDKVHSEYLQTLVDMGPFALIALLSFYVLLLKAAWKYKDDPMVLAVSAAMLCFMIQAVFNFSQPVSTPVVWVMWGVLGALVLWKKREKQ